MLYLSTLAHCIRIAFVILALAVAVLLVACASETAPTAVPTTVPPTATSASTATANPDGHPCAQCDANVDSYPRIHGDAASYRYANANANTHAHARTTPTPTPAATALHSPRPHWLRHTRLSRFQHPHHTRRLLHTRHPRLCRPLRLRRLPRHAQQLRLHRYPETSFPTPCRVGSQKKIAWEQYPGHNWRLPSYERTSKGRCADTRRQVSI